MKDVWTGTWRDGAAANPEGPQPENALTGTIHGQRESAGPTIIPAKRKLRIGNTDVAKLKEGNRSYRQRHVGHEWDEDLDNGFHSPG
jgi:hypothetical protein